MRRMYLPAKPEPGAGEMEEDKLGGAAKSNAATHDGRPLSHCGGKGDGRRGRGRVGMGITVRVARGRGAVRGYIIAWGRRLGRRGEAGPRPLPTVGGDSTAAGRPLGVAGPAPGRGLLAGLGRAARQAELAAQARPGARAVPGQGPVTSGPCRAWVVPGHPCSGRANGPRAVRSSISPSGDNRRAYHAGITKSEGPMEK